MNPNHNLLIAQKLLAAYSNALNSSDPAALSSLYAEGGVFLPSGFNPIAGKNAIKQSAELFFKQKQLNVSFSIIDIVIEEEFAFIQARSKCIVHQLNNGQKDSNTGNDFFVARKEQKEWKVFRYMFNN